jgi:hypothetical protein
MMQYTSVKEIMGRVIDDVGGKLPNHYFDSMLEWLPQGIRMLETKYQLLETSTPNWCDGSPEPGAVITCNHVANLPSNMVSLIAVEDEFGQRVRLASSQVDFANQTDKYSTGRGGDYDARPTNFQVDVYDHQGTNAANGTDQAVPWDGSDIKKVEGNGQQATYKIQGSMIQTSQESMFIKMHYLSLPSDQDGYLLVPDVEEYKQALGFYVLRQLIGAGFKHPVWNGPQGWQHYDNQWEKYMGRALGVIKYPDIDRMERLRTGFAERLIPAHQAYGDFFVGNEQMSQVGHI